MSFSPIHKNCSKRIHQASRALFGQGISATMEPANTTERPVANAPNGILGPLEGETPPKSAIEGKTCPKPLPNGF
jgi:hypothetical protein